MWYNLSMNIYFSGIGGVGIGPLAEIAAGAGYDIFGSDTTAGLTTQKLKARGVDMEIGPQTGDFLHKIYNTKGVDWFVYTSALPEDHPELVLAKQLGIKTSKRDELLNKIIEDKNLKLIAVAGTHGKTSTTGMFVWTLKQLGIPVSWSVGTTLTFGESGHFNDQSQLFIYEADEFDRNFLHFSPFVSLITSLDYDHTDIYKTQKEYFEAFSDFAKQSDFLFSWQDQHSEIFKTLNNTAILSEVDTNLTLPGEHNKRNASLVIEALDYLHEIHNIDLGDDYYERAINALNNFPGTDRRFEEISTGIFSDYGHHPAEIKATLQMAKEIAIRDKYAGVALVYQPHQNVRQVEIQDDYKPDIVSDADKIIWLPTYLSREDPNLEILTPKFLTRKIEQNKVEFAKMDTDLQQRISDLRAQNYLILAMNAGTLDGWLRNNF